MAMHGGQFHGWYIYDYSTQRIEWPKHMIASIIPRVAGNFIMRMSVKQMVWKVVYGNYVQLKTIITSELRQTCRTLGWVGDI